MTSNSNISSIISVLWTAFLFFSANFIASVEAQFTTTTQQPRTDEPTPAPTLPMCSCSPTVFTFVIDLEGGCETNDIEDNPGVDGTFCFVEEKTELPSGLEAFSWSWSEIDVDDEKKTSVGSNSNIIGRQLQDEEEDPVIEIVSVQFLEFDTSGDLTTVINQDDTYFEVSLGDGAPLTFNSASSFLDTSLPLMDQMSSPALVPGGASLILYGKTASGAVVRNRFFWMYDMNCGRENDPVQVGDRIGWVTVGTELGGAWSAFCPALPAGSPTITPRTDEPTLTPRTPPPTVGGDTTFPTLSPTLTPPPIFSKTSKPTTTSMSYDSSLSLSISTVATTITTNTKAAKGKASKKTKTKGAKAA